MTWNSPGGNNKDPWGNRNKQDGPPDIDEMVKKLWRKVSGSNGGGSNSGSSKPIIFIVLIVAALFWIWKGVYIINEQERGVVLHFGEFKEIVGSGLQWVPAGIETIRKVNVNKLEEKRVQGVMLTKDLNIIDVQIGIQYRVDDPRNYLFELSSPDTTLQQAAESSLRQVVGDSKVDALLTTEKERIRNEILRELERILESYNAGLKVEQLTLEKAAPPQALNDAFEDVNRAEQDAKKELQNAEAYRNKQIPEARANAEQMRQQADAYEAKVVAQANGEVARFNKLLPQYEKAPQVTRDRLYLETMEQILKSSTKVMVDVEGGNNMMYLPLDQIMKKQQENR
ncbi:FtsH protease activity modulator HflK [Pleionea sediminis]|uniref:FtsH protease activity modulator HflK n=1 Tax=Pleionea sediminis TaxID=2569479 RepID=UPI001184A4A1|nr:FtsH protease activity modulator HflK [Pleionea sediminis]